MGEPKDGKQAPSATTDHHEDPPNTDVLAAWAARVYAEGEVQKLVARDAAAAVAKGAKDAPTAEELAAIRARAKKAEESAEAALSTWSAREWARRHSAEEPGVSGARPSPGKAH